MNLSGQGQNESECDPRDLLETHCSHCHNIRCGLRLTAPLRLPPPSPQTCQWWPGLPRGELRVPALQHWRLPQALWRLPRPAVPAAQLPLWVPECQAPLAALRAPWRWVGAAPLPCCAMPADGSVLSGLPQPQRSAFRFYFVFSTMWCWNGGWRALPCFCWCFINGRAVINCTAENTVDVLLKVPLKRRGISLLLLSLSFRGFLPVTVIFFFFPPLFCGN